MPIWNDVNINITLDKIYTLKAFKQTGVKLLNVRLLTITAA